MMDAHAILDNGIALFLLTTATSVIKSIVTLGDNDRPRVLIRTSHGDDEESKIESATDLNTSMKKCIERCSVLSSDYVPPLFSYFDYHGHLDTVLPTFSRFFGSLVQIQHTYDRELVSLPDGGTVALDWVKPNKMFDGAFWSSHKKNFDQDVGHAHRKNSLVFIHHGLCGSASSTYVSYTVKHLLDAGFKNIVVFVARGCGGVPLTTQDSFTAARIDDMVYVLDHIHRKRQEQQLEPVPIFGIGYSLGAGLLLNYLGADNNKRTNRLSGALAISPAWNFHRQTPHFSLWSRHVLVRGLQMYVLRNLKHIRRLQSISSNSALNFDVEGLLGARDVKEFDYYAIVKMKHLHGFASVEEYYSASSAISISQNISTPTLALSADNDPVCSAQGCPDKLEQLGPGLVVARTKRGMNHHIIS